MSDSYPEYLNPFAEDLKKKSKLTIRNSFKELKRNLRQSFRIKKRETEEVTLRQKNHDTFRHSPVSYPSPQLEALPRSRFRERISRSERNIPGPNPFEEEEGNNQQSTSTTAKRKGKKKAPLPPKSFSSQNINESNLEVSTDGSHWSLTSADTDYSCSTENASRGEQDHVTAANRHSMVEKFVDFNKDMEKLKDDTNNNVITKEETVIETESNNNIPDLVISCPNNDTDSVKLQRDNETEVKKVEKDEHTSDISEDDSKELVVTDITNNMIVEENEQMKTDKEPDVQSIEVPFEYHEKKSLYVAGSRDELNDSDVYTGRVSLYITGSCDDLDSSNNNEVCNKGVIDENSNDDAVPIPKQRKNKLSKNILLGM